MADAKLRQAIALEAARLMYERVESEYYTAKRKAAKRLCRDQVKPRDLPSNAEIRDQIQLFARLHEGDRRTEDLRAMRVAALRLMRLLRRFKPRLIGSVMTGHVRKGSDIDIHLFTDSLGPVTDLLAGEGLQHEVEHKQVLKHGEARVFTHVHVFDRFTYELTVYPENKAHYVFRSSITGGPIERASVPELEELLAREYPDLDLGAAGDAGADASAAAVDRFLVFRMLLLPLEEVRQPMRHHPEGDGLYHSLQVFELARDQRAYDEEFLLAALLHDVGKALDPADHVAAGLAALEGMITDRTRFLIAHHMDAIAYREGRLSQDERRELRAAPDFDDLMLLRDCDDQGRIAGAVVGTLDEALDCLRELERENG